jgi:hypothetical protein
MNYDNVNSTGNLQQYAWSFDLKFSWNYTVREERRTRKQNLTTTKNLEYECSSVETREGLKWSSKFMCTAGTEGCHQNSRSMTTASDPWRNDRAFSLGTLPACGENVDLYRECSYWDYENAAWESTIYLDCQNIEPEATKWRCYDYSGTCFLSVFWGIFWIYAQ